MVVFSLHDRNAKQTQPPRLQEIDWDTVDDFLTREFVIDDPNRIDGLLDIVPIDVDPVDIVGVYDCREGDIRCSFCVQLAGRVAPRRHSRVPAW